MSSARGGAARGRRRGGGSRRCDGCPNCPGTGPDRLRPTVRRNVAIVCDVLTPARARIACDPDRAGIDIAPVVGERWNCAGQPRRRWRMSAADPRRRLSGFDRTQLAAHHACGPPAEPSERALQFGEHGEKGEQEGLL